MSPRTTNRVAAESAIARTRGRQESCPIEKRVQPITDIPVGGLRHAVDTVGGETFDRSLDCIAVDGRLITCVGTPSSEIPQKLFRLSATLIFEFMGAPGVFGVRLESQGEILRSAAALADQGKLKPHVSRTLALKEMAEGHRLLESGHVTGKLVVQIK